MVNVVSAVMTHIQNPEIRTAAQDLVALLSDKDLCDASVDSLKGLEQALKAGKLPRDEMAELVPPAAMLIGTLALVPEVRAEYVGDCNLKS